MTTTERTKRRSLYPPGHRRSDDPYYVDDTLDAYPPFHVLRGPSTPEEIAAARDKAAERGLLPRRSRRGGDACTDAASGAAKPTKRLAKPT